MFIRIADTCQVISAYYKVTSPIITKSFMNFLHLFLTDYLLLSISQSLKQTEFSSNKFTLEPYLLTKVIVETIFEDFANSEKCESNL